MAISYGSMRDAFGVALLQCAETNREFVVVDADNGRATRTNAFAESLPHRFLDVGCAEQNMVGVACGIALAGTPVVACTFAVFLVGRAFEQIRNTLCMARLPVVLVGTHSGITVGQDGASHFCVEDLALMRALPEMNVLVPSSPDQVAGLLKLALSLNRPTYLRISRHSPDSALPQGLVESGGAAVIRRGAHATIIACGLMVARALRSAVSLAAEGLEVEVIDAYSLKPLAVDMFLESAQRTGAVVVVEEHGPFGGLGEAVTRILALHAPTPVEHLALPDSFASSALPEEMLDRYGLSVEDINCAVRRAVDRANRHSDY